MKDRELRYLRWYGKNLGAFIITLERDEATIVLFNFILGTFIFAMFSHLMGVLLAGANANIFTADTHEAFLFETTIMGGTLVIMLGLLFGLCCLVVSFSLSFLGKYSSVLDEYERKETDG